MKTVKLKDLYLCAFLLNEGQDLLGMQNDGHKFWFIFEDTNRLNELIKSYWDDNAETKIKSYVDKVRDLKDRIFSER